MKVDFFVGMTVYWPLGDYKKASEKSKIKLMKKIYVAFYKTFPQARELSMSGTVDPPNIVMVLSYSMPGMEKEIFKGTQARKKRDVKSQTEVKKCGERRIGSAGKRTPLSEKDDGDGGGAGK
jgi:hypothetical protein